MLTLRTNELQTEFETIKKQHSAKYDEHEVIEREFKKLQDKYREAMGQIYSF